MKYTFEIRETLARHVTIDARNFGEAVVQVNCMLDNEEIVLNSEDFAGGELRLPLWMNRAISAQKDFTQLGKESIQNLDIVLDMW